MYLCFVSFKPWGYQEWNGDWGDISSKWTVELKSKLKVVNKDDGIFWMSKIDFVTQFNSVEYNHHYRFVCA